MRGPFVSESFDGNLATEFEARNGFLEYVSSGSPFDLDSPFSEIRVDALVATLLDAVDEREGDFVALEEEASALITGANLSMLSIEVSERAAFITLDECSSRMSSPDVEEMEAKLRDLLTGRFIEITLTGAELTKELVEKEPEIKSSVLHQGMGCGRYGPSELELFRNRIENLVNPIVPGCNFILEEQEVVITARPGPNLEWCRHYIGDHLSSFPLKISVNEIGEELKSVSPKAKELFEFAFAGKYLVFERGPQSFFVVSKNGSDLSPRAISSHFEWIFGEKYTLEPKVFAPSEKHQHASLSPWGRSVLARSSNRNGEIVSPLFLHSRTHDGSLDIEPHHVSTTWDLPQRDTSMRAIALDPEHSVSDVAFGVTKLGPGRFCLKAWVVNMARLIPIGSEIDPEVRLRGGSLYDPMQNFNLYPPKFAYRYLSLSTEFPRPMLECTMYIDDGDAVMTEIAEVQGTIDKIVTKSPNKGWEKNGRTELLQFEELTEILNERGISKGRVELEYDYDPTVREHHLLLYELIGEWMSLRQNIAVPFRVCEDPLRSISPSLRNLITELCPADVAQKLEDISTRKEALIYAAKIATEEEKDKLFKALGAHSSHSTYAAEPHFLMGVDYYLRVGTGLRFDLARVIQHQVTAAIGGLPALSSAEVRSRMMETEAFERNKSVRTDERRRLHGIRDKSLMVGRSVIGKVVSADHQQEVLAIKAQVGSPIRIYSPLLSGTLEKGDEINANLRAYSLARSAYLID